MKRQQEVSQLIVVAPCNRRAELLQCRHLFTDYMAKRFPAFTFDLAGVSPIEDEDHFLIIPIMNYVTPDGDSYMCKPAPQWLLNEIAAACTDFKPESKARYAA
jgi:hypothetical protein